MSTICNVCNKEWCGCGGGAVCKKCKKQIDEINSNPNLTAEQKQIKLAEFYVNNKPSQ